RGRAARTMAARLDSGPRRCRDSLRLRSAHLVARGLHRLDDVLIARAAAEIGREHIKQFLVADVGLVLKHVGGEHLETRRAEAAVQSVVRDDRAWQRVRVVRRAQAFDGADFLALRLYGEHQAGPHRLAVEDDRTGATDAVLAADVRPGLATILSDGVDQRL